MQEQNWSPTFRSSLEDVQTDSIRLNMTMFQFHGKICLQTKQGRILADNYEAWISPKFEQKPH
jgi:hypothetical protein